MNRYPAWKYVLILMALLFGTIYTAPNFYSSSPALQINSAKSTIKVDSGMQQQVENALKAANLTNTGTFYNTLGTQGTVRVRFDSPDAQFKAKEVLEKTFNPDQTDPSYSVTFNVAAFAAVAHRNQRAAHVSGSGFARRGAFFNAG